MVDIFQKSSKIVVGVLEKVRRVEGYSERGKKAPMLPIRSYFSPDITPHFHEFTYS